jgi:hypothetical protein
MITNRALAILHQKLNFVGSINRGYDDSFAQSGAKIGSSIRIRLPNQYVIRNGPVLNTQDTTENSVTLNLTTQLGVDINFSSAELLLSMDDFSARVLDPAVAVLAANIEAFALNMVLDVYNQVNGMGSANTFRNVLLARKLLVDNLTPADASRYIRMDTQTNVDVVDALKGLFQQSTDIAGQNHDGVLGRTGGFEFAENTFLTPFTRGAENGAYTLNGIPATGATTAVVAAGAGAGNKGDVFTLANVFRVHPETKVNTAVLQQFVLTANYAGGAGTISFSPPLNYAANGQQNINAAPATNAALTFAGTASTAYQQSIAYHKNAFTFATADLVMPGGVDMAARRVMDGLSMRIVRQYDINNDRYPCRIDVLCGAQTIRPQLAARIASN